MARATELDPWGDQFWIWGQIPACKSLLKSSLAVLELEESVIFSGLCWKGGQQAGKHGRQGEISGDFHGWISFCGYLDYSTIQVPHGEIPFPGEGRFSGLRDS